MATPWLNSRHWESSTSPPANPQPNAISTATACKAGRAQAWRRMAPAQTTTMTFIESVTVSVNITHPAAGDVGIELTSPSGMRSILLNIRNGFGSSTANFVDWRALSNAFYGENPNGSWTIKVVDGANLHTGTFQNWSIRILGH